MCRNCEGAPQWVKCGECGRLRRRWCTDEYNYFGYPAYSCLIACCKPHVWDQNAALWHGVTGDMPWCANPKVRALVAENIEYFRCHPRTTK